MRQVSNGALPNSTDLELMCYTACTTSLEALRKTQVAHCTGTDNITVRDTVYPATYTTDLLLFTYGYACLTDSTGDYCFPLFQQYDSGNDTSSSNLCSACNLKTWQAVLDSPLGYSNVLAASYSSLTSSYTTTISQPSTTTTGVTPTYTCESTYTIQESDTCMSISRAKQVSTFYLLYSDKLPAFCTDFPAAGTDICIPQSCNTYTVAPWDTCDSLVKSTGLTTAQLIAYNPNLNAQCGNLHSLAGYVICLSAPGTVTTTVKVALTTTSYFPDPCLNPGAPSSCFATSYQTTDDTPWPTHTVNISATTATTSPTSTTSLPAWTDPASLPVPSGTRENCARYDTYTEVPANATWLDCCNPNYCFAKADS
ncbi:LysM domain-containing protein [Diplogelasinospora grovesii]|uniref:LysM domain-containing protein n=1 Tax=Diplogelasinospora grovesii TaxID=303347 RepID=A0AAN6N3E3_9PEZI|nr:LysM domain-containing protein [Diplogelasinospora grovesii]